MNTAMPIMTRTERIQRHPIVANLVDAALRATRLRDRLRCPDCGAIGTYKPHGTWFDRQDLRDAPRWLCKWCGYYVGPEGATTALLDPDGRVWTLNDTGTTPEASFRRTPVGWAWPWKG